MTEIADVLPPVTEEATGTAQDLPPSSGGRTGRGPRSPRPSARRGGGGPGGGGGDGPRPLGAPGAAVTLITTADPALDEYVIRLIEHLAQPPHALAASALAIPVVLTAEKSRGSTKPGASEPAVAALSGSLRLALDTRRSDRRSSWPRRSAPLRRRSRALQPETIALSPLDRAMAGRSFSLDAYPEADAPRPRAQRTVHRTRAVARLTPGDLLLALRWPDPRPRRPQRWPPHSPPKRLRRPGRGWPPSTLPDDVRVPLEHLVEDLRGVEGRRDFPWRDVSPRPSFFAGPPGTGKTRNGQAGCARGGHRHDRGLARHVAGAWGAVLRSAQGDEGGFCAGRQRGAVASSSSTRFDVFGGTGTAATIMPAGREYVVRKVCWSALDGYAASERGSWAMAATNHRQSGSTPHSGAPGRFDRILHLRHPTVELMPRGDPLAGLGWISKNADLTGIAALGHRP